MKNTHKILGALWFMSTANYMDRIAITFAGPIILSTLGLSPTAFGAVLSAFGLGYMAAQIPGGFFADRWGARVMLVAMPLLWALCSGLTAAMASIAGFVIVRACLGLSEGLSNAAHFKLVGDVFPAKTRTGVIAITSTAGALGPAVAAPVIGFIIAAYGWKAAFISLAIPPILSAAINAVVLPQHSERKLSAEAPAPPSQPITALLKRPSLWVCVLIYFGFNLAYWGYNGWMPSYLAKAHHLDIKHLGLAGSVPYLGAFVGLLSIGWLGTLLHRLRPILLIACYALAGLALYFAFASTTLVGAMTGLTAAAALLHGSVPLFSALMLDLAADNSRATYVGVVFTSGQLAGVIAPFVIGVLAQQSGNFASGFSLMEAALAGAALVSAFLIPLAAGLARPIPQPVPAPPVD